jgi:S1-C subfamily serine protease
MRKILLLLICLPQFLFSQGTKEEWQNYFKNRTTPLYPIEGIWSISYTYYNENNCYDCKGYGTTDQIDHENDGLFAIYKVKDVYIAQQIENHVADEVISSIQFQETAASNVFLPTIYYDDTYTTSINDQKEEDEFWISKAGKASLTESILLEFSYVRKTMLSKAFYIGKWNNKWNNDVEYYKHQWIKIFPNSSSTSPKLKQSSGTGFALSSGGYIVTNYHVIDGASKIEVKGIGGDFNKKHDANLIISDKNNDLAILKVNKNLGTIPYKIASKTSEVATDVYTLGFPLRSSMGDEIKFTKGNISSKSGFQGDITTYQHTIPIQPGNSGGPMFDDNGFLIGIINAKHLDADNASYSIKSKYLLNIIDESSSTISHSSTNLMYGKSIAEQVEQIRSFIYIIEAR